MHPAERHTLCAMWVKLQYCSSPKGGSVKFTIWATSKKSCAQRWLTGTVSFVCVCVRLDTITSLPIRPPSHTRLWLVTTCTLSRSVSATMHKASATGSSSAGCCTYTKGTPFFLMYAIDLSQLSHIQFNVGENEAVRDRLKTSSHQGR